MNKFKLIKTAAAIIIVVIVVIIIAILSGPSIKSSEELPLLKNNVNMNVSEPTLTPMYILKEYNDRVAIFLGNSDTPNEVLDNVRVSSLPDYDRQILKSGIPVYSEDELQSLIEDLES